jgi:hypothetical protein
MTIPSSDRELLEQLAEEFIERHRAPGAFQVWPWLITSWGKRNKQKPL